ncbi:dynamin family protein [Nakamurella deserti]|uniref:dynamin family protein n=1 Tax=Nakamurella deserti TaxID=2164074 RepID=UPI000DBE69CA|nr:dynamin family protein [Nakamurella deserti]
MTAPPDLVPAVAALLDEAGAAATTSAAADTLRAAGRRLTGPLRVALAGKLKAGKSTLLNALVGEELAPTDAGECTSIVTWYSEGPVPEVVLHPHDGPPVPTSFARADGALQVDLAGRAAADLDRIEVRWPTSRLRDLTLIDTPGTESLSAELSARTLRLLVPEDGRPSEVDAVLYLLRHAHASDGRFLEAFHDVEPASGTPLNTVGVLSRADEIGSCRVDALEVAARVAQRYQADPRLRRLCPVVVPVAGLLGHAGVTLRENDFRGLTVLAAADAAELGELLLTADRLAGRDSPLPLDLAARARLLDRFGLFGVRLAVDLIRGGSVGSATALAVELDRRSGLDTLRVVLARQFTGRSRILQARSALLVLDAVLRDGGCRDAPRWQARAEEIRSGAHAFEEMRLLDQLRTDGCALPDEQTAELERLLGGGGVDPAARLGMPAGADADGLRRAAVDALLRWQGVAEHPLTGRVEVVAARGAARSIEGILAELPPPD